MNQRRRKDKRRRFGPQRRDSLARDICTELGIRSTSAGYGYLSRFDMHRILERVRELKGRDEGRQ